MFHLIVVVHVQLVASVEDIKTLRFLQKKDIVQINQAYVQKNVRVDAVMEGLTFIWKAMVLLIASVVALM